MERGLWREADTFGVCVGASAARTWWLVFGSRRHAGSHLRVLLKHLHGSGGWCHLLGDTGQWPWGAWCSAGLDVERRGLRCRREGTRLGRLTSLAVLSLPWAHLTLHTAVRWAGGWGASIRWPRLPAARPWGTVESLLRGNMRHQGFYCRVRHEWLGVVDPGTQKRKLRFLCRCPRLSWPLWSRSRSF